LTLGIIIGRILGTIKAVVVLSDLSTLDGRQSMPSEEKSPDPKVQANDNSTAVGKIEIGGSVGRDVIIGGTHIHNEGPAELAKPPQYFEPETILIPEGSFWMGSEAGEGIPDFETPQHEVTLPGYRVGKYPVTNAQYQVFIDKTKTLVTRSMHWMGQMLPEGQDEFPVRGVTWYEALAYCRWLSDETGRTYRLPNEAQWEKACRGGNNYLYPWGDEFDSTRCNHGNSEVAPVDSAKPAQNDYGGYDFVGNIRQWTCSLWGEKHPAPEPKYAYPWKNDRRNDVDANNQIRRVIRGSSFREEKRDLRCSLRNGQAPEQAVWRDIGIGFRVVMIV
jgi:formylglycine-generating enzyme required for sulfatase activity